MTEKQTDSEIKKQLQQTTLNNHVNISISIYRCSENIPLAYHQHRFDHGMSG